MAIVTRQPSACLVVYTDQGSQYASDDDLALLAKYEITASMSGRGHCYDNAVMESFFLTAKRKSRGLAPELDSVQWLGLPL